MSAVAQLPWTLETELAKITATRNWSEALVTVGLAGASDQLALVRRQEVWERGGAETFVYRFFTVDQANLETAHILKACVPGVGVPIEKVLADWLSRRSLLASVGVSTPKLYAASHGLIWEECLPTPLEVTLRDASEAHARILLSKLAVTLNSMYQQGFDPVDPTYDLWSRGEDVVLIDFGQDLGPAGRQPAAGKYVESFNRFAADNAIALGSADVERLVPIIAALSRSSSAQLN